MSAYQALRTWAATSTLAHVGFAFFAMGGWAVFANRAHPFEQALLSGVVQGAASAFLTLVLKKFLEWFSGLLAPLRQAQGGAHGESAEKGGRRPELVEGRRAAVALVLPPLITAASILAILLGAHTLAGTPEIAATIAVPFTVSTTYAIVYNWGLWRRRGA